MYQSVYTLGKLLETETFNIVLFTCNINGFTRIWAISSLCSTPAPIYMYVYCCGGVLCGEVESWTGELDIEPRSSAQVYDCFQLCANQTRSVCPTGHILDWFLTRWRQCLPVIINQKWLRLPKLYMYMYGGEGLYNLGDFNVCFILTSNLSNRYSIWL